MFRRSASREAHVPWSAGTARGGLSRRRASNGTSVVLRDRSRGVPRARARRGAGRLRPRTRGLRPDANRSRGGGTAARASFRARAGTRPAGRAGAERAGVKYLDEYRDGALAEKLVEAIRRSDPQLDD